MVTTPPWYTRAKLFFENGREISCGNTVFILLFEVTEEDLHRTEQYQSFLDEMWAFDGPEFTAYGSMTYGVLGGALIYTYTRAHNTCARMHVCTTYTCTRVYTHKYINMHVKHTPPQH